MTSVIRANPWKVFCVVVGVLTALGSHLGAFPWLPPAVQHAVEFLSFVGTTVMALLIDPRVLASNEPAPPAQSGVSRTSVGMFLLVALLLPAVAHAQTATTPQKVNDAISYGTVGANVLMDVLTKLEDPSVPKTCSMFQEALKIGIAIGVSEALKASIHRLRPDGSDYKDFPSEHTAIAEASRGWSLQWGLSLSLGTGTERYTANKHDVVGVLGGLAVGEAANWLGPKLLHCS